MGHATGEMPSGAMQEPMTAPSVPATQNMGDVFRATARQSSQPQAAPSVPAGKMPGEEEAHDEVSGRTTRKMSGQRPKKR